MILPLPYIDHKNTSMTSLTGLALLCPSPASYFVILRAAWFLHPAFLQDSKTPYILTYQVSNFQTLSSFSSTLSFSTLTNTTMTRPTRSNTTINSNSNDRFLFRPRSRSRSLGLGPRLRMAPRMLPTLLLFLRELVGRTRQLQPLESSLLLKPRLTQIWRRTLLLKTDLHLLQSVAVVTTRRMILLAILITMMMSAA